MPVIQYRVLRELLEQKGLLSRAFVIPGNHDHDRLGMLAAFPECESTPSTWKARTGEAGEGQVELSFTASVLPVDGGADGEEWRLIGLDSLGTNGAPTLCAFQSI